jgi:hypothetical protein
VARGDVQRVGAGLGGPQRDLLAFGILQAFGEIVVDRDAEDHRHAGDGRLHRAQHLEAHAGAMLERPAVFVGAAVLERIEELRNQIAVRGVDLDHVEPGLARADGGGGIGVDGLADVERRHRARHDGLVGHLEHRMGDRGRCDRRLAADVESRVAAAVAELDGALGAARVDFARELEQPRDEAVVVDAELAKAMTADARGGGHLDRDQADAAAHARHVVVDAVVGDEPLVVGEARRHRRHNDAVSDLDRSDPRRREEDVHRRISSRGSRRRPCRSPCRAASGRGARP